MDKRTEKIIENMQKHRLNEDSAFMFHCTMCGQCCRNRDDILLNPNDLYKLSKGLKLKPQEVVEKYCDYYIGSLTRLPIIRLKSIGFDKHCILLSGNACSVQTFKPTVCALFPLGRYKEISLDETETNNEIFYLFNEPDCGDKREIHTVRSWLKSYDIPTDDEFYVKWSTLIHKLSMSIKNLSKRLNEQTMNKLWTVVFNYLYLDYDIEKEFMPQFKINTSALLEKIKFVEGGL